jgi:hypothetical protein
MLAWKLMVATLNVFFNLQEEITLQKAWCSAGSPSAGFAAHLSVTLHSNVPYSECEASIRSATFAQVLF